MLKLILLLFSLFLYASPFKKIDSLTTKQYNNLIWVYKQGKKYNLELTLTAIAWQESKFGKYPINLSDPSGGLFHNLLGSVCYRLELTPNQWNQSRILEKLISDKEFALQQAVAELYYWKSYWKVRNKKYLWKRMISSYNGGHKGNVKYYRDIVKKIRYLKRYFKWLNKNNPTFK